MSASRVDPFALNPEKFLAEDAKAKGADFSGFPPICFSRHAKDIFFDRLRREAPNALCQADQPEEFKLGMAALKDELIKEMKGLGLSEDHMLFAFLFSDVLNEFMIMRSQKGSPES